MSLIYLMEWRKKMTQTNENKKSKKLWLGIVGVVVLVALIIGFVFAYKTFGPKATEGAKAITIEVIDNEQASRVYDVNTDAEFLRQAIEETEGLSVAGQESEYGLMIEEVNGLQAIYETDGAYWSVMVNGEYGMLGIDSQPVTDGDEYQLVYTPAE